jgi:hypothetical protein
MRTPAIFISVFRKNLAVARAGHRICVKQRTGVIISIGGVGMIALQPLIFETWISADGS